MREADLPSPGFGSKSMHLRRIAANMISYLQMNAIHYADGIHPDAAQLATFFTTCATAATEQSKASPAMTIVTAGNATSLAVGSTLATTVNKGGSTGAVTYVSSRPDRATVDASGVITGVAAGNVTITAYMATATGYKAADRAVKLAIVAA